MLNNAIEFLSWETPVWHGFGLLQQDEGQRLSSCLRDQGNCHELCLDETTGETFCRCRDGFVLNDLDRLTCEGK